MYILLGILSKNLNGGKEEESGQFFDKIGLSED